MSYDYRVEGELTITPPLEWGQLKESTFFAEGTHAHRHPSNAPDVKFLVEEDEEETSQGFYLKRYAAHVVPYREEPYRCRTILDDIRSLIGDFPENEFRGIFILTGEYVGDLRRILVDERGVREEKAKLIWPDGSEVKF